MTEQEQEDGRPPRTARPQRPSSPPPPPPLPRRRRLKTLIVDDNIVNLRLLQRIVTKSFPESIETVKTFSSALGLIHELTRDKYDLLLADIDMPDMSGLEAALRIRGGQDGVLRANREIIIIAVTTNVGRAQRDAYAAAGMQGCIAKPVCLLELSRFVALARNGLEDQGGARSENLVKAASGSGKTTSPSLSRKAAAQGGLLFAQLQAESSVSPSTTPLLGDDWTSSDEARRHRPVEVPMTKVGSREKPVEPAYAPSSGSSTSSSPASPRLGPDGRPFQSPAWLFDWDKRSLGIEDVQALGHRLDGDCEGEGLRLGLGGMNFDDFNRATLRQQNLVNSKDNDMVALLKDEIGLMHRDTRDGS